jgi:hypothetical protein
MLMPVRIALLFALTLCEGVAASDKPNILLIYTDDQGYGDVSCLNAQSKFLTPNLDRLAREGLTLTEKITKTVNDGRSRPGEPVPNDTGHWPDLTWILK